MDDMLVRLIWMQRNLQKDAYGYDFARMTCSERIQFIRDQHQALVVELSEVLGEVDWKPWASGPRTVRRDAYVAELIDVLHFWLNMALVVSGGMSSQELADEIFTRFALKNRLNAQRQVDGYDGRSTKCGGCGRALDDPATSCWRRGDQGYCADANVDVNYLSVQIPVVQDQATVEKTCPHCERPVGKSLCTVPTTQRWGFCGFHHLRLPPLKLPTT